MSHEIVGDAQNNATAVFHPDTTRDLLIALARPRNSHIELFRKPVLISPKDLGSLAQKVGIKLKQLRVEAECILMKTIITFDKDRTYQLVGWKQLREYNWEIPERTNAIVLAWEFMFKRDEHSQPELHVLSVRITESINAMQ